jgi:TIR domain/PDZ domain
MADIFISYAAEDRDRARQLALALEERGWDVWWDREIPLGRLYDDAIEQALAEARCAIVLWSHRSIASEWVRSEASEAKRRGILVPVFLEAVEPPLAFRLLHGADLTAWEAGSPHEEFEHLTQRMAELVAQRTRTPPGAGVPAPRSAAALGGSQSRRRHWWWAAAAAALSLLVIGVLLTGAYVGRTGTSGAAKPTAATEIASRPAAADPTHNPPAEQLPDKTTHDDFSGLMSALQNALSAGGGQSPLAALTAFELKDLAVKIVFLSDQELATMGLRGALPTGAVVFEVGPGTASRAGLHPGDVITAIGSTPIKSADDLRKALHGLGPGKTRYGIRRDGRELAIDIDCPACTVS